jgi:nitrite reductase/ring-hydroxylating ferredoxin subunit
VARVVVARADEIPPGARKLVDVDGRSIGVFNVDGTYWAVRNRCPHQGGPLCAGVQVGAVTSDGPGSYTYERSGEILRCPWHAWEFDIRTGASWFDPSRARVRAYEVELLAEDELDPDELPPRPGLVRGPYRADTVPASVEGRYIVLDV